MTNSEITKIVSELTELANTRNANNNGATITVHNPDIFQFGWTLNNNRSHASDKTIKVDNVNDAVQIVSKFSGKDGSEVKDELQTNTIEQSNDLYLHFSKII